MHDDYHKSLPLGRYYIVGTTNTHTWPTRAAKERGRDWTKLAAYQGDRP